MSNAICCQVVIIRCQTQITKTLKKVVDVNKAYFTFQLFSIFIVPIGEIILLFYIDHCAVT